MNVSFECLLNSMYNKIKEDFKKQKTSRYVYNCIVLIDVQTDSKHISVMNLCVHYKLDVCFIRSIEGSDQAHT